MNSKWSLLIILVLGGFMLGSVGLAAPLQQKGGRSSAAGTSAAGTSAPAKKSASPRRAINRQPAATTRPKTPKAVPPAMAEFVIYVRPYGSEVRVQETGDFSFTPNGTARFKLKPGYYNFSVQSTGYKDYHFGAQLQAGDNRSADVVLVFLPGKLNVTPNLPNATLTIINVRQYYGRIENAELAPGLYQIEILKEGYKKETRTVEIKSDRASNLHIKLEKLPPPRTGSWMSAVQAKRSAASGDYYDFSASGTSGEDLFPAGTIYVSLFADEKRAPVVTGMFPGLPCHVTVRALDDNIKDLSLSETPGPQNNWGKVGLRVTPKKNKKEMRFVINWYAVRVAPEPWLITPYPDLPASERRSYVNLGQKFRTNYPLNWQERKVGKGMFFAPPGGISNENVTHGIIVDSFPSRGADLQAASIDLVAVLQKNNPTYSVEYALRQTCVEKQEAFTAVMSGISPITREKEIVTIYAMMPRKGELLYLLFIRPQKENDVYLSAFGRTLFDFGFF